jgi:glycosyltransferase involved in cell wall biosynthesis
VYAFGGERLERVTKAIEDDYEVVYQQEVLGSPDWKRLPVVSTIGSLYLTYRFLRRRRPIVLVDEFGLNKLLLLVLAHALDCYYLSRIRGSMWDEFGDYAGDASAVRRWLTTTVDHLVRNAILRRADRILAVSYFNRMQLVYELHVDPERIDVVYETCDLRSFDEARTGAFRETADVPTGAGLLLTVTNFDYREKARGIEYFLPGIERVLREHPDWHYVIAGDGTFRPEFERRIRRRCGDDVVDRISFVGFYSPIQQAFVDADLVVHPSFRDAIPNTVIEAQAARRAVVVNSDGGMQESLPDDFHALQVVHEPDDFGESLDTLIDDPDLRRRVGDRNRAVARDRFDAAAVRDGFQRSVARTLAAGDRSTVVLAPSSADD